MLPLSVFIVCVALVLVAFILSLVADKHYDCKKHLATIENQNEIILAGYEQRVVSILISESTGDGETSRTWRPQVIWVKTTSPDDTEISGVPS